MSLSQIFKRILIPCAAGVTTVEGHTYGPNCYKKIDRSEKNEEGIKPSDLPIYAKYCAVCGEPEKTMPPPSSMEEKVGNIRRELWVWQDSLKGYRHKIVDVYRKGFSKADYMIDYLREEPHGPQRIGAIGISGLTGYILGMRKGIFRRLFYASAGALGMAFVCYPNEAMDYLEAVVLEGRRYFIIAYHFLYGESPKTPEWLEKYLGPFPEKEEKAKSEEQKPNMNETIFDLKKILPSDEKKEKKS